MAKELRVKPIPTDKKLQFLNSIYYRPMYNKNFKEMYGDAVCDFLAIIYRNEETNEKKLKIMPNPEIQFFVANDDVEIKEAHLNQIELDKVHIERVKNKHLLQYLCDLRNDYLGLNVDFVKDYYKNPKKPQQGVKYEANKFHLFNRVFASDINIEDFWKGWFIDSYPKASNSKLTKSYTDIEVDSIDINGFPNEDDALCPVNALTVFFDDNMTFYTLLLRNPENPLIEEFEGKQKEFIKRMKKTFGKEYKFKLLFYDEEIDLITDYFQLMDIKKPDFDLI